MKQVRGPPGGGEAGRWRWDHRQVVRTMDASGVPDTLGRAVSVTQRRFAMICLSLIRQTSGPAGLRDVGTVRFCRPRCAASAHTRGLPQGTPTRTALLPVHGPFLFATCCLYNVPKRSEGCYPFPADANGSAEVPLAAGRCTGSDRRSPHEPIERDNDEPGHDLHGF